MSRLYQVIADFQAGKAKAFNKLLAYVWGAIDSAHYKLGFNADWYQEARAITCAFAKGWNLGSDKDFESELYGVLSKEAAKYYYHNYKKHHVVSNGLDPGFLENQGYYETDTLSELDRAWLKERLTLLVKGNLDATDANILYLYFYKNLSQPQIASKLGITQQAVSLRLNNSLKDLKQILEVRQLFELLNEI
jgi:RNA polymerase sigma factor (sigma-70 family)